MGVSHARPSAGFFCTAPKAPCPRRDWGRDGSDEECREGTRRQGAIPSLGGKLTLKPVTLLALLILSSLAFSGMVARSNVGFLMLALHYMDAVVT